MIKKQALSKNLGTLEGRAFWAAVKLARAQFESWPQWKRDIFITTYSQEAKERMEPPKNKTVNKDRVMALLNRIPEADKDTFYRDVLGRMCDALEVRDQEILEECLGEWEATIELMKIPGLVDTANRNFDQYKQKRSQAKQIEGE